jgi:hypothetical protein
MKIEKSYIDKLEFTEKDELHDNNTYIEQKIITGGMSIKNMGLQGEDNMVELSNLGVPVGLITSYNPSFGLKEYHEPEFNGGDKDSYRENNNFIEKKTASLELNDGLLKLIQLYKSNKNKKTKKLHKYSAPSNKNISKHK